MNSKEIMMKELTITWLKSTTSSAAQIYESGLQYCLVNKEHEQCHPLVFCKDFIQDAVHGFLNNKVASIYGFTYDPAKMPKLSLDRIRLLLVNSSDAKFGDRVLKVIDLLNQVEAKLKLKHSHLWKVSNPPKSYAKTGAYYISGSGQWLNSPVMVSMYSLMIRAGFNHTIGTDFMTTLKGIASGKIKSYQNNDQRQVSSALKGIEKIIEKGYRKFFYIETQKNYPANTPIGTMHNSTGIIGFTTGSTKSICPYWTRKSIDSPKKVVPTDGATTTVDG